MDKKDVPQDAGLFGKWHGICYVTDETGKYTVEKSAGWEPVNIANGQAWEVIEEQINSILEKIKKGELSPLAYHMEKNLMDLSVLAQYAGYAKWRVKRHLKAKVFRRLSPAVLDRYARIFNMTREQLTEVPNG